MPDLPINRIVSERVGMCIGEPCLEVEFEGCVMAYPRSALVASREDWARAYLARLDRLLEREMPYDTTVVDAVTWPILR